MLCRVALGGEPDFRRRTVKNWEEDCAVRRLAWRRVGGQGAKVVCLWGQPV